MLRAAINGNPRAYEAIRETIGEKNAVMGSDIEDLSPLADLLRE